MAPPVLKSTPGVSEQSLNHIVNGLALSSLLLLPAVLSHRLVDFSVALTAQCHQVRWLVTHCLQPRWVANALQWYDVMNDLCRCEPSVFLAFLAQRMLSQDGCTKLSPPFATHEFCVLASVNAHIRCSFVDV